MTKRQYNGLQRYIDRLRPMLGLTDYEVVLKEDPPENAGNDADHKSIPACHTSVFRVSPRFFTFDPEYQREIIVHELLHCVHNQPQDQIRHVLPEYLDGNAGNVFVDLWFQSHEYAIDKLYVAISGFFPLPRLAR